MAIRVSAQHVRNFLRANKRGNPQSEQNHRTGSDDCLRFLSTRNTSPIWPNSVPVSPSASRSWPWGQKPHRPQENPAAACDPKSLGAKPQRLPVVGQPAGGRSASWQNRNSIYRIRLAVLAVHGKRPELTESSVPLDPKRRFGGAVRFLVTRASSALSSKKKNLEGEIRLDSSDPQVRLLASAVAQQYRCGYRPG